MTLLDRRRAQSERELRRLIAESGMPPPPDAEISEIADFFARSGPNALPQLRKAFEEMVAEHRRREGGDQ
jgi:hypothetical protein